MSCNANMVASKTPIGVVFDTTNGLAIAKDEFANMPWGAVEEDVSGVQNSSSGSTSVTDWQGFKNTKAMYEADKSGVNYPAIKKVLTYSTEGTEQGQWYLPAAGELQAILTNKYTLNTTLAKIGGTQMSGTYWSSSEQNSGISYCIVIGNISSSCTERKIAKNKAKPVINFGSKNKTDFAYVSSNETACGVGSILYSDKKCYAGSTPSGKTPIGIVFDRANKLAIGLEESRQYWSTTDFDVPGLSNITSSSEARADWQGKKNTQIVLDYCKAKGKSCPAFEYVNSYKTEGTIAGDWYLPAFGELSAIYGNKDVLNIALGKIGRAELWTNYYWSSSEDSNNGAWVLDFFSAITHGYNKSNLDYYVRPVLAF